jgi:hypothetical protein
VANVHETHLGCHIVTHRQGASSESLSGDWIRTEPARQRHPGTYGPMSTCRNERHACESTIPSPKLG